MYIVQIESLDASCHTLEADALVQKQRFIDNGISEEDISIIEKSTFEPPME